MRNSKTSSSGTTTRKSRPAISVENRENQLIAEAMDCAEEQLRNRTASSQVITHFLKLGTVKAELELEKLRKENALLEAKKESLESAQRSEELYKNALNAMRLYSGQGGVSNSDEDEDDYY